MSGNSANRAGALWMLASVVAFTVEATLIKAAGSSVHPVLILFWRQAVGVVLLAPLVIRSPRKTLATGRPGLVLFRSGVGILGILLGITALSVLPMADATALSFSRVLWIALIAALVLGAQMGPLRIAATLTGFLGVLVLIGPGRAEVPLGWHHAAALSAALLSAITTLSVKQLSRNHSVVTLTVYAAGLGLILSSPFALAVWRWPTPAELPLLLGVGAAGLITLLCYTRGMQLGEAVVMAPIDYTRLIGSGLVGLILFQEKPTLWLLAGAVLIVAANLMLTFWKSREPTPAAPEV